jgi:tetratricopeptide (TPR) repeat protein
MKRSQYPLPPAPSERIISSIKLDIISSENLYDVPESLDMVTVRDLDEKRTFTFQIDHSEENVPSYVETFASNVSPNTSARVTNFSDGKVHNLVLCNVKRRRRLDSIASLEDRVEEAAYLRDIGNACFRAADYERALRRYEESLRCVDYCHVLFHDSSALPSADLATLLSLLNTAACHLKLKNYQETINFCNRALELDQDNAKAYFRRGCAYIHLRYLSKARCDLNRAEKLDSNVTKRVQKKLRLITEMEREDKAKFKKAFAGVFG